MNNYKNKVCSDKECYNKFKQYNSLNKYCSIGCQLKNKKQASKKNYVIPKVSEKRKEVNKIYEKVRIEVLVEANFKCFIDGCTNVANTVEHLMKRKGYADEWARENNIPLMVDKRYLRACCLIHNGELETNHELSKEYQYSNISGKKKSDL